MESIHSDIDVGEARRQFSLCCRTSLSTSRFEATIGLLAAMYSNIFSGDIHFPISADVFARFTFCR